MSKLPYSPPPHCREPCPGRHAICGDVGNHQHRRAAEARFDDAEQPGGGGVAALRHEHPRLAGQAAIHVGHARRRLLVACQHHLDFVLPAVQRLEYLTGVAAGKPEDVIDACLFENVDNFINGAHAEISSHELGSGAVFAPKSGVSGRSGAFLWINAALVCCVLQQLPATNLCNPISHDKSNTYGINVEMGILL